MPTFTVFKGTPKGVKKSETTRPDLQGDQVYVKVTASGLCGTDLHYREGKSFLDKLQSVADIYCSTASFVLGHEGVGVVEEVGPATRYLKKGDRVGWGYEQ